MDDSTTAETFLDHLDDPATLALTCGCSLCQRGREIKEIRGLLRAAGRPDLAESLQKAQDYLDEQAADKEILEGWEMVRRESRVGRLLLGIVDYLALRRC